jgi:hypothetical protein
MDQQIGSQVSSAKAFHASAESTAAISETPPPTPPSGLGSSALEAPKGDGTTPPAKRFKQGATTVTVEEMMKVETNGSRHAVASVRTPSTPAIQAESSKESLLSKANLETQASVSSRPESKSPSDLISAFRERGSRDQSVSPVTPYVQHEVPPAPPSTPAGEIHAMALKGDGSMTPLPYFAVQNADLLERQQLLAEGVATPAPTKPLPKQKERQHQQHHQSLVDDFSDWAVGERYKVQRMLGRGSYGEVAQAVDLYQDQKDAYVAIKRIQSPFDQEVDAVRLFREIHILRRLRGHDCVIQLLDVVQPPSDDLNDFHDLYLVFDCK